MTDSGRDSELIFTFDGRQAAKIPDWVVPQNLTDHFTIATWMKHGPSHGLRAEKETLLCNSDKTGEWGDEREETTGKGVRSTPKRSLQKSPCFNFVMREERMNFGSKRL